MGGVGGGGLPGAVGLGLIAGACFLTFIWAVSPFFHLGDPMLKTPSRLFATFDCQ
jgi:hypothetical protein